MKKRSSLLLSFLLATSLLLGACGTKAPPAEPTPTASADALYAAGTYSATAKGNNGLVTVEVVFTATEMQSVKVIAHEETTGISDAAIEKIPLKVVEWQSLAVDAVSGATNTSNAILEAVALCVVQAGGDPEMLKEAGAPTGSGETISYTEDCVIVGAGGAGLIAAITALEGGQNVLLLEKRAFAGGATMLSEGYIAGGGSRLQSERGVTDSADVIYEDLMTGGKNRNQPDLARIYADNMGQEFDWLTDDIGVTFTEASPLTFPEHTNNRVMVADGGGAEYVKKLLARFDALGGKLLLGTEAKELLTEDGAVVGVRAVDSDGNTVEVKAELTLLTCGGFGASPDLRPAGLEDVVFYGATSSTGDGIKMAQAAGAQTILMDTMKIYPQGILNPPEKELTVDGALAKNGLSCAIGCKTATNTTGSIYVNVDGERFINENTDFVSIKEAQLQQPDKRMFLVMDQRGLDAWYDYTATVLPKEQLEQWFEESGMPIVVRGADLGAMAAEAGINADALVETVAQYNAMVPSGEDAQFGRTLTMDLSGDTYYMIELKLRTATTLGGVKTNVSMQVLDNNDQVISGLLAAGEMAGGANGVESMPSCMNAWSLVSARQAGRSILTTLQ